MTKFIAIILRFRWPTLVILGLLTGLGAYSASRGVFASSIANLFLGENPQYQQYQQRIQQFANDRVFIIFYRDENRRLLHPVDVWFTTADVLFLKNILI